MNKLTTAAIYGCYECACQCLAHSVSHESMAICIVVYINNEIAYYDRNIAEVDERKIKQNIKHFFTLIK